MQQRHARSTGSNGPASRAGPAPVVMLLPKTEPSENGVFVGGYINAVKSLCQGILRHGAGRPFIVTSLPSHKHALFTRHQPDWAEFHVMANNWPPQSVLFGATFVLKTVALAFSWRLGAHLAVHGHSGYAVYTWATLLAARIAGKPSVHTIYCPVAKEGAVDGLRRSALAGAIARYPLNKIDKVVAISENVARSLQDIGVNRAKIEVIPPSIDSNVFSPDQDGSDCRTDMGLPPDAHAILYVGNLMYSKGFDLLAEAFKQLVKEVPDVYLIATLELAHKEFDRRHAEFLKDISRSGLERRVRLLGFVNDMPSLMAAADVFVVPYRDTQGPSDFPIAAMEAMATGKPVVATRTGALPELVRDGVDGLLVDVDNPSQLCRSLARLVSDKATARRYGRAGRDSIVSRFSIEATHRRYAALYQQLTARHRHG